MQQSFIESVIVVRGPDITAQLADHSSPSHLLHTSVFSTYVRHLVTYNFILNAKNGFYFLAFTVGESRTKKWL
jgi:hypothetical protein